MVSMKTVLIWGFYHQGNLGDDLMGMMIYEMLEELGAKPFIFSSNKRFQAMGYRAVDDFTHVSPDIIMIGGGAFFKSPDASQPAIEENLKDLETFIRLKGIPVHGVSIGSDGVSTIEALSPPRKAIVLHENFKSVVLRLSADEKLGLADARHLFDIVFLCAFCSARYSRLTPIEPGENAPTTLINISRRSSLHLPRILWRERKNPVAFFRAHTGEGLIRGEIALPWYKIISDDRIRAQLGFLQAADRIISAKLHPGVISLSFGNKFEPLNPRPKTTLFLNEMEANPPDQAILFAGYMSHLKALIQ